MPAQIETMFYVRETPWHGLGTKVEDPLVSKKFCPTKTYHNLYLIERKKIEDEWENMHN